MIPRKWKCSKEMQSDKAGSEPNINRAVEETYRRMLTFAAAAAVEGAPDTQPETLTEGECVSISERGVWMRG